MREISETSPINLIKAMKLRNIPENFFETPLREGAKVGEKNVFKTTAWV